MKLTDLWGKKREMISRRENKEIHNRNKGKKDEKEKAQQKEIHDVRRKIFKRRRWRQNKNTDEEKTEVRNKEGSKTKMKQK